MSFVTVLMAVCLLINVVLLIRAALGREDKYTTACAAVGGAFCSLWWIGFIASQYSN